MVEENRNKVHETPIGVVGIKLSSHGWSHPSDSGIAAAYDSSAAKGIHIWLPAIFGFAIWVRKLNLPTTHTCQLSWLNHVSSTNPSDMGWIIEWLFCRFTDSLIPHSLLVKEYFCRMLLGAFSRINWSAVGSRHWVLNMWNSWQANAWLPVLDVIFRMPAPALGL